MNTDSKKFEEIKKVSTKAALSVNVSMTRLLADSDPWFAREKEEDDVFLWEKRIDILGYNQPNNLVDGELNHSLKVSIHIYSLSKGEEIAYVPDVFGLDQWPILGHFGYNKRDDSEELESFYANLIVPDNIFIELKEVATKLVTANNKLEINMILAGLEEGAKDFWDGNNPKYLTIVGFGYVLSTELEP